MLGELRIARRGGGQPRTTPDLLRADKSYSSRGNRRQLHARGIKGVIPEPSDQAAHRKPRGSHGGRPVSCDTTEYKRRFGIESGIGVLNSGEPSPPDTTTRP